MNKNEILNIYKKEEDRLLIAKTLDKLEFSKTRNKISYTNFLDLYQKHLIQKMLKNIKYNNYTFWGGEEDAERTIAIFHPDKFNQEILERNYNNIMQIVEIILPNEIQGKYTHKDYLGGLMKLGIKREKIGDIIVFYEGAHIVVLSEIVDYVKENISNLTRFSKARYTNKKNRRTS